MEMDFLGWPLDTSLSRDSRASLRSRDLKLRTRGCYRGHVTRGRHLLCLPVQPAGAVVCWWPGKVTVGARWPGLGAALPSCNTAALDQLRRQSLTLFRGEEINIFIAKYFIELRIFPFQLSPHTQWHRLPPVVTMQSLHAAASSAASPLLELQTKVVKRP